MFKLSKDNALTQVHFRAETNVQPFLPRLNVKSNLQSCNIVLTLEPVDKNLKCDHPNDRF